MADLRIPCDRCGARGYEPDCPGLVCRKCGGAKSRPALPAPAAAEGPDNWDPERETALLIQNQESMERIMDGVRALLPPGTDFSLLVSVPPTDGTNQGRVLAFHTNRDRMTPLIWQWTYHTLPGRGRG